MRRSNKIVYGRLAASSSNYPRKTIMVTQYPAIYRDEFGEETVTIENDGKTLSLVLRGREFKGKNFHSLGILDDLKEYTSFNICLGDR